MQLVNNDASIEIANLQQGLADNIKSSQDKKQQLLQFKTQFQTQIKSVVKDAKFYEENDACPTCSQDIGEDLRKQKLVEAQSKAKELNDGIEKVAEQSTMVEDTLNAYALVTSDITQKTTEISANNSTIASLQKQTHSIENEIESLRGSSGDLSKAN